MGYYHSGLSRFPLVPGHEWAGEVLELGPRVPEHLRVGQRVAARLQRAQALGAELARGEGGVFLTDPCGTACLLAVLGSDGLGRTTQGPTGFVPSQSATRLDFPYSSSMSSPQEFLGAAAKIDVSEGQAKPEVQVTSEVTDASAAAAREIDLNAVENPYLATGATAECLALIFMIVACVICYLECCK
eukprot:g13634.t1